LSLSNPTSPTSGFIDDGLHCEPDRWDCIARGADALCSEHADCIGRRCRCREGYTGDGTTCLSMKPHPGAEGCQACHCKADWVADKCKCWEGYFGNGVICVPDPDDCVNYPGLCYPAGKCNQSRRKCECSNRQLVDNGMKCLEVGGGSRGAQISTQISGCPQVCQANAECASGACRCIGGYVIDEYGRCVGMRYLTISSGSV